MGGVILLPTPVCKISATDERQGQNNSKVWGARMKRSNFAVDAQTECKIRSRLKGWRGALPLLSDSSHLNCPLICNAK